VICQGLPREHFECLPDEIQATLVEQYPQLSKYLSPDEPVHDQATHEALVQEALHKLKVKERLPRTEQLIETAVITLMQQKKPEEPFVPHS
jgi:hypothetical protein